MISNTVKAPLPLDGTPQDMKTPSGDPCFTSCTFADGVMTITETMKADENDKVTNHFITLNNSPQVICTMYMVDDKLHRKFTNKNTGTFYTGILQKQ